MLQAGQMACDDCQTAISPHCVRVHVACGVDIYVSVRYRTALHRTTQSVFRQQNNHSHEGVWEGIEVGALVGAEAGAAIIANDGVAVRAGVVEAITGNVPAGLGMAAGVADGVCVGVAVSAGVEVGAAAGAVVAAAAAVVAAGVLVDACVGVPVFGVGVRERGAKGGVRQIGRAGTSRVGGAVCTYRILWSPASSGHQHGALNWYASFTTNPLPSLCMECAARHVPCTPQPTHIRVVQSPH